MKDTAINKIKSELAAVKKNRYYDVIKQPVSDALESFCGQSEEFARAVTDNGKTLEDCLAYVIKGVSGGAISDAEAYRRAAEFYFPGAVIDMRLSIRMSEYETETESQTPVKFDGTDKKLKLIDVSLLDLL